jgi:hypothetical protein
MPYHMTHAGKHKRKKEQDNDIPFVAKHHRP